MAAGAALLGAALATAVSVDTAGLGNYQFLSNGSPAVKIVVGANAAASDGVAAANIAAMIGNMAYRSQDVTASMTGAPTCSVTGEGGACSISNKKATIAVTAPGAASADVYSFHTLLGVSASEDPTGATNADFIDSSLENRAANTIARSPYSAGAADVMRKIDSSLSAIVTESTVRDNRASRSYTQKEYLYAGGRVEFDSSQDVMAIKSPEFAYATEFSGDVYGIPCSTGSVPDCTGATLNSDKTENHHLNIKWLGSTWVITQMTPLATLGACVATGYNWGQRGGSIKLAKESIYVPALTVGSNMSVGPYTVVLSDITSGVTAATLPRSAFKVYDSNGVLKDELAVDEGATETAANTGLKIHVYTAVPGLFANARWAEVAVYEEEMELRSGERLNVNNNDWKVELIWTSANPATDANCDSLYAIELRGTNLNTLYTGSVIKMPATNDKFQMKLEGIDLSDSDYDQLTFDIIKNQDIATNSYTNIDCTTGAAAATNINVLKVTSQKPDAFKFRLGASDYTVDYFYYDMDTGTRYFYPSGINCWLRSAPVGGDAIVTGTRTLAGTPTPANAGATWVKSDVEYQYSSSETSRWIRYYVDTTNIGTAATQNWFLNIEEDNGNNEFGTIEYSDSIDVAGAYASDDYVFYQSTAKVGYMNRLAAAPTTALPTIAPKVSDVKLITDRGSMAENTGISTTRMIVKYARKLGKAKISIMKSGASDAGADSQTLILGEGESGVVGSTTVKVNSISATATAAAGSGCTVESSGVSCAPSISSAAVVTPIDTSASKLVVLDSDAEAAATSAAILVGGPAVNTITQQAIAGSELAFTAGSEPVVKVIGSKVIVAGYSAADTRAAANELIKFLASKRA